MSNSDHAGSTAKPAAGRQRVDDHLDDVGDECGCVEIWEFLSEHRSADRASPSEMATK